jgi:hypothetical protein
MKGGYSPLSNGSRKENMDYSNHSEGRGFESKHEAHATTSSPMVSREWVLAIDTSHLFSNSLLES